jgi:hypothetical protein
MVREALAPGSCMPISHGSRDDAARGADGPMAEAEQGNYHADHGPHADRERAVLRWTGAGRARCGPPATVATGRARRRPARPSGAGPAVGRSPMPATGEHAQSRPLTTAHRHRCIISGGSGRKLE